mgnify:CR=1 FL=1
MTVAALEALGVACVDTLEGLIATAGLLAYLPEGSTHFDDYVQAVEWAQRYAMTNRTLMMDAVIAAAKASASSSRTRAASARLCRTAARRARSSP